MDPHGIDERTAFEAAATWFRSVVERVEGRWDEPGLGEWSVRDLVGHTSRSLLTVENYLGSEPGEVTVDSAAAYYAWAIGELADQAAVAERGRQAGLSLGADPAAFLADLDQRVQAAVAAAEDDAFVASPAGGMRLADYLPTRTFELVVHTADLASALGAVTTPPPGAIASALRLATALAAQRGSSVDLLLALTGRRPLPDGFSVL